MLSDQRMLVTRLALFLHQVRRRIHLQVSITGILTDERS